MKLVFFSLTGQTRRFVSKTELSSIEILPDNPFYEITEPFILVVPTYDEDVTEVVDDFLDYKQNKRFLIGIAGSGNLNFGPLFVYTAKNLAKKYSVPLLYSFEFSGTIEDIKKFKKVVSEIDVKRPDRC